MHGLVTKYKARIIFIIYAALLAGFSSFMSVNAALNGAKIAYIAAAKYGCVLLCFALGLFIGKDGHDGRDRVLLQIALGCACIGDVFLTLLNYLSINLFVYGAAAFAIMQPALIARHARGFVLNRREVLSALCVYPAIAVLLLFLSPVLMRMKLFIPVSFYAFLLATNLWLGIGAVQRGFYQKMNARLVAAGVFCFMMGDLFVILLHALRQGALGPVSDLLTINMVIESMIWIFYLPSLALLASSGYRADFLRSVFPAMPNRA